MTWAHKFVLIRAIKNRAGVVGAQTAVGEIGVVRRANQDAGIAVRGVLENQRAADGDITGVRNQARGICLRVEPFSQPDKTAGDDSEYAEGNVFCESAARDLLRFRCVDGAFSLTEEIVAQGRLPSKCRRTVRSRCAADMLRRFAFEQGIENGHEQEGEESGKQEASNDGESERLLKFGAGT